jgi:hypothetical protein
MASIDFLGVVNQQCLCGYCEVVYAMAADLNVLARAAFSSAQRLDVMKIIDQQDSVPSLVCSFYNRIEVFSPLGFE